MKFATKVLASILIMASTATTVVAQGDVAPGPCLEKRKQIHDYLIKAKKAGMGTTPYEKALEQIEIDVKAGKGEDEIKKRLSSLTSSLSQQVSSFKAMKAAPPAYHAVKPSNGLVGNTPPIGGPATGSQAGQRTSTGEMESYMVTLVNKHRGEAGLGSLGQDSLLSTIARGHALDMVKRRFFDHTNPSGEGPRERAAAGGYTGWVRENIAYTDKMGNGLVMVEYADQGLMKSPGHKKNILAPQGTTIGVGIVFDTKGGISVCQLFSP